MDSLLDSVKHIRLIHFTLLVTSVTLIYVGSIISDESGKQYTAMLANIEFLNSFLERSNESLTLEAGAAFPYMKLNSNWAEHYRKGLESALKEVSTAKYLSLSPQVLNKTVVLYEAETKPIDLKTYRLRDIDSWISEYMVKLRVLAEPVDKSGNKIKGVVDGSDRIVGAEVTEWRDDNTAIVNYTIDVSYRGGPGEETEHAYDYFSLEHKTNIVKFGIPKNWRAETKFNTAGKIEALWNAHDLQTLETLEATIKESLDKQLDNLEVTKLSLAGSTFQTRHIGVIGPVFQLGIMMYLLLFLMDLLKTTKTNVNCYIDYPIWVGLMGGVFARASCFLTMAVIPAFGSYIIFYNLFISSVGVIGLSLLIFFLGFIAFLLSGLVGLNVRQKADSATVVSAE
jgi:hypothetical protein